MLRIRLIFILLGLCMGGCALQSDVDDLKKNFANLKSENDNYKKIIAAQHVLLAPHREALRLKEELDEHNTEQERKAGNAALFHAACSWGVQICPAGVVQAKLDQAAGQTTKSLYFWWLVGLKFFILSCLLGVLALWVQVFLPIWKRAKAAAAQQNFVELEIENLKINSKLEVDAARANVQIDIAKQHQKWAKKQSEIEQILQNHQDNLDVCLDDFQEAEAKLNGIKRQIKEDQEVLDNIQAAKLLAKGF